MSELKPCPFCGEENTDTGFILHKDECYLMLRYMGGYSKHEMINAWNTRPIEDKLQAEIDRLKAERRWIPVKNRHPEHGERVFVKMRNGWVGAANYANRKENAYRWMNTDGKGYLFEVTHWMPLPPPPEGEA